MLGFVGFRALGFLGFKALGFMGARNPLTLNRGVMERVFALSMKVFVRRISGCRFLLRNLALGGIGIGTLFYMLLGGFGKGI